LVIHRARFKKNLQKSTLLALNWGWNSEKPSILVVNWVSSCLSFFMSASTATYIFTALTCTTTIISLKPCASYAEFQHFALSCCISYWGLIKCPYFADTIDRDRGDRGWKEAQRQGEDRVILGITLVSSVFFKQYFALSACRLASSLMILGY
jgi:hypothetical protein